jgi:transposase
MAKTYRPYVPEQDLLLPPSLREWLPEDHLAFFVSDLIDQLDLSAITTVYEDEERGYPPYHPVMLTKVLVYAYCVGGPPATSRTFAPSLTFGRRICPR